MWPEQIEKTAQAINAGKIGVMPTDTIYGLVGRADLPEVVERIYLAKQRPGEKKFIKLIASYEDLRKIGIEINQPQKASLQTIWPGPVSAELPTDTSKFHFLHHGSGLQAVRMPEPAWLQQLLKLTGPVIATSANLSGQPVPKDIQQIKEQLPGLDFYINGHVGDQPSRLVAIDQNGKLKWLERL